MIMDYHQIHPPIHQLMVFGAKQRIHRHHIRRWSPVGHRLPELQGTLPALGGTTGDDGGAVGKGVHQISGLRAAADGLPPHIFFGKGNRMDLNHMIINTIYGKRLRKNQ